MLEVKRVSAGYPDFPVLFDVRLQVERGELVTLLGGNAAGKSTLLKTVLGDVPVAEGDIVFDGRPVTHLPVHERVAAGIAYVPEGRRALATLSVRDNLVAATYGLPGREVAGRLATVHEVFPVLAERDGQRAGLLSGGEQQMLAIGRALMRQPRLLMVDELSLGLAPLVVADLYDALRRLCRAGLAVLVCDQFQRFEPDRSDRWVVLERGTVLATGGREDAHLLLAP